MKVQILSCKQFLIYINFGHNKIKANQSMFTKLPKLKSSAVYISLLFIIMKVGQGEAHNIHKKNAFPEIYLQFEQNKSSK